MAKKKAAPKKVRVRVIAEAKIEDITGGLALRYPTQEIEVDPARADKLVKDKLVELIK